MRINFCFIVLLLISFSLTAQENQNNTPVKQELLTEVTVSALHINDSLLHAPASIGIISKTDLQKNNQSDITPAINNISGVFMQSGSYNTNRISIRGIGARTPFGTNKIRAFYGSIPLTSGDSETTIEDIDTENIEQIEIIKGPLSSLYGAGLGGAIIIAPKLSAKPGNSARITTVQGSFGLLKNSINYSLDKKSASLNISYHKLRSDGWRENSAYNREGVTIAGELFRKNNNKLTYFSNYTYLKAFIPSSIDKCTFDNNPKAAAFTWNSAKGFEQYDSWLAGLAYDSKLSPNISNATAVFFNYKKNNEPRPFDILKQNTTAYGARTQFSANFGFKPTTKFIIGLEYFRDRFNSEIFKNLYQDNNGLGSLQGEQIGGTKQNRSFYNAFAQLRSQFSKKFEAQAGINVNKTKFELDNVFPVTSLASQNYSYDAIYSPQLSLLYKPSDLQTLYASICRGFSLPSVEETLTASGTVNSTIKPESGYNLEVGEKLYLIKRTLFIDISLYRMQIKDLLVAQRIGDDQYVGINAGETLHQGIECSARNIWQLNKQFSIKSYISLSIGSYEFLEFNDRGNDFSGNKLSGVSSTKANAGITVTNSSGLYLSADFRYVDKMPLNDANSINTDSYRLLDLKTGYNFQILPSLNSEIAFGINNATNEHYASMILPNATSPGTASPRYYYPGLPVNYYANISLQYIF